MTRLPKNGPVSCNPVEIITIPTTHEVAPSPPETDTAPNISGPNLMGYAIDFQTLPLEPLLDTGLDESLPASLETINIILTVPIQESVTDLPLLLRF